MTDDDMVEISRSDLRHLIDLARFSSIVPSQEFMRRVLALRESQPVTPGPLPAERPLSEDHVRELRAEELRLRVQHEQTGERLAAISAVLVASGEARLKQHQEARQ